LKSKVVAETAQNHLSPVRDAGDRYGDPVVRAPFPLAKPPSSIWDLLTTIISRQSSTSPLHKGEEDESEAQRSLSMQAWY
jgi:hypothetical protein